MIYTVGNKKLWNEMFNVCAEWIAMLNFMVSC